MIAGWDDAWELYVEDVGTLPLNQEFSTTSDWRFQLVPQLCSAVLPVRSTEDDVPQGDGKIAHRRWRGGFQVHLAIALLNGDATDCVSGADLVEMLDELGLYLNAAIRTGLVPGSPNARLIWTPDGASDDRMFDRVQLIGEPTVEIASDEALGGTLVEVDFDSVYPWYIAATEEQVEIADGQTVVLTNNGNTDFLPVLRVYGSFGDGFTVTNNSVTDMAGNPLTLVYDATLPGAVAVSAPDYIEFGFFGGTAYLNGNQANMKAGIDMRYSDFWPLIPGDNAISVTMEATDTDAVVLVLFNDAWA